MGVMALKKLMKDVQEVANVGATHLNIGMPSLFRSHALKYGEIKTALKNLDLDEAKRVAAQLRNQYRTEVGNLRTEVGDAVDNLGSRRPLQEARQHLLDAHERHVALRDAGDAGHQGLSDAEKLANQYAKRVLDHYVDPKSALSIARTAFKSAVGELQATYDEDVSPAAREAVARELYQQLSVKIVGFGQEISFDDFMSYVAEVKK